MKASFIDAIKNLLPRGAAFDITHETSLRKLFEAIAVLPEKIREEMENVYLDYFPDTTRSPEKWEEVFRVIFTADELNLRRKTLALLWSANQGGQSLHFIESALQTIAPELHVYENIPKANPRNNVAAYFAVCGNDIMRCGNKKCVCAYREGDEGYETTVLRNDTSSPYSIPNNPDYWSYCFFVCDSVARNAAGEILYMKRATLNKVYKNYIEYLILKLKPVHTVAVMSVQWV